MHHPRHAQSLIILCLTLTAACAHTGPLSARVPAHRLITGDLAGYDTGTNRVSLRVDGREVVLQLTPSTVLQEGANFITADHLNDFRGHFTKATVAEKGPMALRLMISPEDIVRAVITGYDPVRRVLTIAVDGSSRDVLLDDNAWCHVGDTTIDASMLMDYQGQGAKLRVSKRTGRVLSVFLSGRQHR